MSRIIQLWIFALMATALASCAITRTETDYYTITDRDTTFREVSRNAPATTTENGVVFPSSRTINVDRQTLAHDSSHDRLYPNFLRAGGIETAGLIGTTSLNGMGPGLFGLYDLLTLDQVGDSAFGTALKPTNTTHSQNSSSHLFKGLLFRLAPYEKRLRWFDDAPDWTIGWSAVELLARDENRDHWLASYGTNIYIRKRFFIRDRIPYIIFSPYLGASLYPSMYGNLGAELHVGSLAGLNFRLYAGLASGFTWTNNAGQETFPYLGIGFSVMDFTNTVEETEHEWKEYVHTGINFNVAEASLMTVYAGYPSIIGNGGNYPVQGIQIKLGTMEIPLPILNYHFWAGTSLINWIALGNIQQGLGVLPLRAGYRHYLISDDLMLEPFIEYSYYPSSVLNAGIRLKWDTFTKYDLGLTLGFATGSPGNFTPSAISNSYVRNATSFSSVYLGISFFLGDWNYTPEVASAWERMQ
ncbi:MAG TPA: hypothetical protein VEW28_00885 [Candidatus Kapabacteria bacterium]|nr:hypothetical protein [Candidatus Kapabacteria bacterium]